MASKDIRDLTPFLQRVFFNANAWYIRQFHVRRLVLTCTYRDTAEQQYCYASGRTRPGPILTKCDGIKKKSMHGYKPARAFDFAVEINGRITWNEKYYNSVWAFFRQAKLTRKVRWGGRDFGKDFRDWPHIEEA